jgi:S1-C subfamily serine protease
MLNKYYFLIIAALLFSLVSKGQNLPTSTEWVISKGSTYNTSNEVLNVFLIYNPQTQSKGTGFLIKSGHIITNEHVVHAGIANQLILISADGKRHLISKFVTDSVRDLAILTPANRIKGGIEFGDDASIIMGKSVYTWGFPLGYNGPAPILSVGYIAGKTTNEVFNKKFVDHLIINGALNPGNSGGALLLDGKIVGVVQSKHAPISPYIKQALDALSQTQSGVTFTRTSADGKQTTLVEAQIVAEILNYYRGLTQVMIGEVVTMQELKQFLTENKITGF